MTPPRDVRMVMIELVRRRFGTDYHPAVFAQYGHTYLRTGGDIRPPAIAAQNMSEDLWLRLCHAYTTAQLRTLGHAGHDNRSARAARRWRKT